MKNVVLLEYFNRNTDDTLLLGFFSESKLKETINYYNMLSGFSKHTGDYIYKEVFSVEGSFVYLLQIWNVHNENIVCRKVFESKNDAQNYLNGLCQYSDDKTYDSTIDKYIIDEKCWLEGFVTL